MWLQPYFELLEVLPYTFLALLTTSQLVDMLRCVKASEVISLPTNGIIAAAKQHSFSYHVRTLPVNIIVIMELTNIVI